MVDVPARGTWVLALLAAVFLMHGPPTVAASDRPAGPSAAVVQAVAGPHAGAHGSGAPVTPGHDRVAAADHGTQGDGAPAHTAAQHAWAACLAVLLAGLALLAALVRVRRLRPVLRDLTAAPPRSVRARPVLPRPPDLAALCVLRT